jgi:hypothetical protein
MSLIVNRIHQSNPKTIEDSYMRDCQEASDLKGSSIENFGRKSAYLKGFKLKISPRRDDLRTKSSVDRQRFERRTVNPSSGRYLSLNNMEKMSQNNDPTVSGCTTVD